MSILRFAFFYIFLFTGEFIYAQQIINTNGGLIAITGPATLVFNNASFINNGTFTAGKFSNVSFTGATAYSIGTSTTLIDSTNFYNLYISNTADGTINPYVAVQDTISVTAGRIISGGNFTLLSNLAGTANVSAATISTGINGNVNVQRYIPAKRAWRLLTAPVSGSATIFDSWQNSGNNTAGMGMFITGPGAVSKSIPSSTNKVLDYSPRNNSSMKTWNYNATVPAYVAVANTGQSLSTGTGTSAANTGYFVFIRGDRNAGFSPYATPNITTLTATGPLQFGTQTFPASGVAGNYTLIGNPYAAPVDFTNVTRTNLVNRFYAWDPLLNTVGGYVTVDKATNASAYTITPSSGTTFQTQILQSSQAFFIQTLATGAASISFNETNKTTPTLPNTGFRPLNPLPPGNETGSIAANIYLLNADSSTVMADGNLTQFNNNFSDSVLVEDAIKFTNINETFGVERHGVKLALESRPDLTVMDTLFLNLSRATQRAYQFNFFATHLDSTNLTGFLEDKYLHTKTAISLCTTTLINFNVDTSAASAASDRFKIMFKTLLPFSFIDIDGHQKNRDIAVNWKVTNETDIVQYDVEKSADGFAFTKIATQKVIGTNNKNNSYTYLDTKANTGDNIYRIKMMGLDGENKYTGNVLINMAPLITGSFIYPNPVINKQVHLQMNNQPPGDYSIVVTNNSGQTVYTGMVQNTGNNNSFVFALPATVAAGMYTLKLTTPLKKMSTQKLIVE